MKEVNVICFAFSINDIKSCFTVSDLSLLQDKCVISILIRQNFSGGVYNEKNGDDHQTKEILMTIYH